jgi:molybdenum cofactor cytidylyltransferase
MSPVSNQPPLGVVILGAGASTRMGRPKLLLPWRGTSVIGHLRAQWQEVGAAQIAVVCRAADAALQSELDRLDFPKADRIENPQPGRGMFSSIVCAANWSGWRRDLSRWALVLGDQPHLQAETLRRLRDFSAQNREAICQPMVGGRAGHPVILPHPAFMELKDTTAPTLKEFLKLSARAHVQVPVADAGLSLDMDTPEDYKRLHDSLAHEK